MINLTSDLGRFYLPKVSLMHILCLETAFGGSPLKGDVWVQKCDEKVHSVITRQGGRLYIYSDCAHTDELKEFISFIGFGEIFCEKQTADALGLEVLKEFNVLIKKSVKTAEFDPRGISLKSVYEGLKMGSDEDIDLPDFEVFAPDLSHRLRHKGGAAVCQKEGCAVAFSCQKGGIINGIAVDKTIRKHGFGSKLLKTLCSYIEGDILVCADNKNTSFYIKNGFNICDTAVIAR